MVDGHWIAVYIGRSADGYKGLHEGFGSGSRNPEGDRILEFGDATEMVVVNNTFIKNRDRRLVKYKSCNSSSQLDCW